MGEDEDLFALYRALQECESNIKLMKEDLNEEELADISDTCSVSSHDEYSSISIHGLTSAWVPIRENSSESSDSALLNTSVELIPPGLAFGESESISDRIEEGKQLFDVLTEWRASQRKLLMMRQELPRIIGSATKCDIVTDWITANLSPDIQQSEEFTVILISAVYQRALKAKGQDKDISIIKEYFGIVHHHDQSEAHEVKVLDILQQATSKCPESSPLTFTRFVDILLQNFLIGRLAFSHWYKENVNKDCISKEDATNLEKLMEKYCQKQSLYQDLSRLAADEAPSHVDIWIKRNVPKQIQFEYMLHNGILIKQEVEKLLCSHSTTLEDFDQWIQEKVPEEWQKREDFLILIVKSACTDILQHKPVKIQEIREIFSMQVIQRTPSDIQVKLLDSLQTVIEACGHSEIVTYKVFDLLMEHTVIGRTAFIEWNRNKDITVEDEEKKKPVGIRDLLMQHYSEDGIKGKLHVLRAGGHPSFPSKHIDVWLAENIPDPLKSPIKLFDKKLMMHKLTELIKEGENWDSVEKWFDWQVPSNRQDDLMMYMEGQLKGRIRELMRAGQTWEEIEEWINRMVPPKWTEGCKSYYQDNLQQLWQEYMVGEGCGNKIENWLTRNVPERLIEKFMKLYIEHERRKNQASDDDEDSQGSIELTDEQRRRLMEALESPTEGDDNLVALLRRLSLGQFGSYSSDDSSDSDEDQEHSATSLIERILAKQDIISLLEWLHKESSLAERQDPSFVESVTKPICQSVLKENYLDKKYLKQILCVLPGIYRSSEVVELQLLHEIRTYVVEKSLPHNMVSEIIKVLVNYNFVEISTVKTWQDYQVAMSEFSEDLVFSEEMFSATDEISTVKERLKQLIISKPPVKTIWRFVEKNLPHEWYALPHYLSLVLGVLCEVSIQTVNGERAIDKTIIKKYIKVFHTMGLNQLQLLYAAQRINKVLEYPAGLICLVFKLLHEKDVVDKEDFLRWRDQHRAFDNEGRDEAKEVLQEFFVSILDDNDDSDDDDDDDVWS